MTSHSKTILNAWSKHDVNDYSNPKFTNDNVTVLVLDAMESGVENLSFMLLLNP